MQEEIQSFTQTNYSDYPMMSETEAQNMISVYNQTIDQLVKENKVLSEKFDTLNVAFQQVQSKNEGILNQTDVEEKRQLILVEIVLLLRALHLDFQEEELNTQIALVLSNPLLAEHRALLEEFLLPVRKQTQQDEQIIHFDQMHNEELLQEAQGTDPTQHLIGQIVDSIIDITRAKQRFSTPRPCIKCHQSYNPMINNSESCQYHPGKMKFYSCKKCGTDEYFTCCLRCFKCSEGCRFGVHAPKIT